MGRESVAWSYRYVMVGIYPWVVYGRMAATMNYLLYAVAIFWISLFIGLRVVKSDYDAVEKGEA